ncbi:MAG: hypothetical protein GY940_11455 [bacterium]|nr:hypothetical protein [bacterium]
MAFLTEWFPPGPFERKGYEPGENHKKGMTLIFLRVPELVIGARETENTIGNGFGDGYI